MDRQVSLLSQHVWLQLPQDTRNKLAKLFDLKKSGTIMTTIGPEGAQVISDGYNFQDFYPITVKRMNEILAWDEDDFYALFNAVIENIDSILDGSYGNKIIKEIQENEIPVIGHGEVPTFTSKPQWCNMCSSRGVRHKKECPRYVPTR